MNFNIDLSQLRDIDPNDVGKWPQPVKVIAIVLLCSVVLALGLWFDTKGQWDQLESFQSKEQSLRVEYAAKQHKAANLSAYQAQMEEMKLSFGTMLRQLPSTTEVAGLLEDISQTGIVNGLEFELFEPAEEISADFYSELPIKIKVVGNIHDFGRFVSDVAALSRIVTLHDFSIVPYKNKDRARDSRGSLLMMQATAKTYHYFEETQE